MYKHDAIYYDKLNEQLQKEDIAFYNKLLTPKYSNILELACGTGRILFSLEAPGRQLTGLDQSVEMLNMASKKAEQGRINCNLISGNMCCLSYLGKFDAIICGYNSIQHILNEKDLSNFFDGIIHNLDDEGIVVIDLFHSNSQYLFIDGHIREVSRFIYDSSEIIVKEKTIYHPDTQINDIVYSYYDKGGLLISEEYMMKQYEPEYLDCFIEKKGFSIDAKYGNYDFSNYSDDSPKQIYILKRK